MMTHTRTRPHPSGNMATGARDTGIHWLCGNDDPAKCLSWARFRVWRIGPDPATDTRVDVLATMGLTGRIDRTMSREDARKVYRDLLDQGWRAHTDAQALAYGMTEQRLRLIAYD